MATKKTKPGSREALIVLGMHRSGTSALSGVLVKLGAQAPGSLMPPTQDNPRGYWESTALMKFHDRVLESAGIRWDDWDGFNPEWIESPAGQTFVADLSSLLDAEYGDARLILVKDPRMCRLFPLWAAALGEFGITPKVVIPVRHPDEVARSLATRDQMGGGQAQLLWLRHLLDAEASTRGVTRAFLRYTDLLNEWQPEIERLSDQLGIKWTRQSGATTAEINDYLAPQLRHHAATTPSSPARSTIARWAHDAYRAIDSLIDNPRCPDSEQQLDSIHQAFNETSRIYAPVIQEQLQQFERRIEDMKADANGLAMELKNLDGKHQALQQENLLNYRLYEADHKALVELGGKLQGREDAYVALMSRHEIASAQAAEYAGKEERARAREAALSLEHQRQLDEAAGEIKRLGDAARAARAAEQVRELRDVETIQELHAETRRLKEAARLAEESLEERFTEIAGLAKMALGLEGKLASEQALLRTERDKLARVLQSEGKLASAQALLRTERDKIARELQAVTDESASVIRVLKKEAEAQGALIAEHHAVMEALRSTKYQRLVSAVLRLTGAGVELGPGGDERSDEELLRSSHLFDRGWYLERYPDVRSRGMDPIKHYLKYGGTEGRDPGACFSTRDYVARYPDVLEANINPLVHYLKYGRAEGRLVSAQQGKD